MPRSTPAAPERRRDRRAAARLERAPRVRSRSARGRSRAPARWSPVALVSVAALVAGLAIVALALPKGEQLAELHIPPTRYDSSIANGDVLGRADAPVLVELYSDFQCPACRLFVTTQLQRLTDEFVRPGTVRIEARDIAFLGRGAVDESLELAVGAACAAEQGRYWQFHDLVFWNQGRENRGDHDAAFMARLATEATLDRTGWDRCIALGSIRGTVQATTAAALTAGISSTPTLVVNGESIVGVPDYDELAAAIRRHAGDASR